MLGEAGGGGEAGAWGGWGGWGRLGEAGGGWGGVGGGWGGLGEVVLWSRGTRPGRVSRSRLALWSGEGPGRRGGLGGDALRRTGAVTADPLIYMKHFKCKKLYSILTHLSILHPPPYSPIPTALVHKNRAIQSRGRGERG